jgi:TusA-related sulfurtransferase
MKVNGRMVDGPKEVILPIPRSDGDLIFKFKAILNLDEFEKMCPTPTPPKVKKPGGEIFININDPAFKKAIDEWSTRQMNWRFLTSIAATEGLEWATVKMDDPGTWGNWENDLKEAGFSVTERNVIFQHFMKADTLTNEVIEEARKRFLDSEQAVRQSLLSQTVEPKIISNGGPVSVSVLDQRESEKSGKTTPTG